MRKEVGASGDSDPDIPWRRCSSPIILHQRAIYDLKSLDSYCVCFTFPNWVLIHEYSRQLVGYARRGLGNLLSPQYAHRSLKGLELNQLTSPKAAANEVDEP